MTDMTQDDMTRDGMAQDGIMRHGGVDGLALRRAIGLELLERCRELGLTPGQLAARADVPLSTLKNILDGHSRNPGVLTLLALCGGLDVPLADFIAAAEARARV